MSAKKSFKDDLNPAMQFISTPPVQDNVQEVQEAKAPPLIEDVPGADYKVNPYYIEKRNKRLQLLVQPSLYEKIKKQSAQEGCSVNDLIHRILEDALKGE